MLYFSCTLCLPVSFSHSSHPFPSPPTPCFPRKQNLRSGIICWCLQSGSDLSLLEIQCLQEICCKCHLDHDYLSASNPRSSKYLVFLSFTLLVPPKTVWNPRANVLKRLKRLLFAFALSFPHCPFSAAAETNSKILGELQAGVLGWGSLFYSSVWSGQKQFNPTVISLI